MRYPGNNLTGDVMTYIHVRPLCKLLQRVFSTSILLLGFIGAVSLPSPPVAHGVTEPFSTSTLLVKRGVVRSRAPARRTIRPQSRRPRNQQHVVHPHAPRRHIHGHERPGWRTSTMLVNLPNDCEEVSGEDATFYCEGVYYKAYYQGNDVVYVPESETE